jgi:hypothetical protein
MAPNPKPNKDVIQAIAAVRSATRIHSILTSGGLDLALDVIQFILSNGGFQSDLDKACVIDFCARHGGISLTNIGRFLGTVKTNRCSHCRWIGHNKNYCPNC